MSMSDPLGDMLTRIRNGQQAGKEIVECPHAKLRERVCAVLQDEGYIRGFTVEEREGNKRYLQIQLKYSEGEGVIRELDRVSKPGCRVYSSVKAMPRFYNGLGIFVVSTPKGVMPEYKAKAENIGGEVLCRVF